MKFITFILSFYLVALSCLPCADMEVTSASHSSKKLTSNHEDHSHDKENDLCSPFCVCNCCGTQFVSYFSTTTFDFATAASVIAAKQSFYKSTFSSNFYGSIWQPPQIG